MVAGPAQTHTWGIREKCMQGLQVTPSRTYAWLIDLKMPSLPCPNMGGSTHRLVAGRVCKSAVQAYPRFPQPQAAMVPLTDALAYIHQKFLVLTSAFQ